MTGKLYLIPSFMGEDNLAIIPAHITDAVMGLNEFVVENLRTARRYLRAIGYTKNFDTEVILHELNKHEQTNAPAMLANLLKGKSIGIISEAGNPCIADPGYELVHYAHSKNISVVPLVGASSILLALIASGMNGQQFTFSGYLPIPSGERVKKLKQIEDTARRFGVTQLFMETPFRNMSLLRDMLSTLDAETRLCIACDLTLPTEYIATKKVEDWRKEQTNFHKRYCIYVIG